MSTSIPPAGAGAGTAPPASARLILCLALFVAGLVSAQPAHAFAPIQQIASPGGIVAWLVEDHSVPIVTLEASFAGSGSAADPQGKEGLANLTAELLTEGAGPYDSASFQTRLDDRAISLGFSAGAERLHAALRTLSRDRAIAFEMLRFALTEPRFDAEPIERVRAQILAQVQRSRQDPRAIANRVWYSAAFPGHSYGRPGRGTATSIGRIQREDLLGFAAERIDRGGLIVSVVGDITAAELAGLLDQTFGRLASGAKADDPKPAIASGPGGIMVVPRAIPQSVVTFGQPGILRSDPDFIPAFVLNHIIGGGGFGARLMTEIREKRGLAYGANSSLVAFRLSGLWMGSVATQNGRVAQSIDLVRQIWREVRENGVTAEELADAKTYLIGSYPLRFDSSRAIAGALAQVQEDNLGIDYFDRRNALIERVSLDDLRRVARRLMDPEALVFVVVGQPSGLEPTRPVPDQPS
ncbi:MAG: insulinase family protein [Proteobacteria bacterium]|nr:insulinase family protein [Pseudomonadota bacterium]MBI3495748.1 insulinase family protein [Pseudomonadota bacterium]